MIVIEVVSEDRVGDNVGGWFCDGGVCVVGLFFFRIVVKWGWRIGVLVFCMVVVKLGWSGGFVVVVVDVGGGGDVRWVLFVIFVKKLMFEIVGYKWIIYC